MQGSEQKLNSNMDSCARVMPVFRIYSKTAGVEEADADVAVDANEAADAVQLAMASHQSKHVVLLVDNAQSPQAPGAPSMGTSSLPLPEEGSGGGVSRETISTICEINGLREQQSLLLPNWAHTNPTTFVLLGPALI
jgi:hypothetical protein